MTFSRSNYFFQLGVFRNYLIFRTCQKDQNFETRNHVNFDFFAIFGHSKFFNSDLSITVLKEKIKINERSFYNGGISKCHFWKECQISVADVGPVMIETKNLARMRLCLIIRDIKMLKILELWDRESYNVM